MVLIGSILAPKDPDLDSLSRYAPVERWGGKEEGWRWGERGVIKHGTSVTGDARDDGCR